MPNFIITFGQNHVHRMDNDYIFNKDSVAIIKAESRNEAHNIAMNTFKGMFHQCISETNFDNEGWIKYYPRGKMKAN